MERSLIRCPACGSNLIGACMYWPLDGLECAIDRACPDCGHSDTVVTSALAGWALSERDQRIAREIEASADRLAA